MKITNEQSVLENVLLSYAYWDDAFTEDELSKIVEHCEKFEDVRATIGDNIVDKTVRNSKIAWIPKTEESLWVFNRINNIIDTVNEKYFRFDLTGYKDLQYTKYAKGGTYNWHMDCFLDKTNVESRKLSLTLLLNDDFEGGEFCINKGNESKCVVLPPKKGRALLFPSFLIHKVNPVTKGTRKSLVAWCNGPKFK